MIGEAIDTALALTAAFASGYATRRYRPLHRINAWAWNQDDRRTKDVNAGRSRRRPGWYAALAVFAVELAAWSAIRPWDTVASLRERRALRRQQRETL